MPTSADANDVNEWKGQARNDANDADANDANEWKGQARTMPTSADAEGGLATAVHQPQCLSTSWRADRSRLQPLLGARDQTRTLRATTRVDPSL
eukprot:CAMPEP_0206559014 /NCGR_PEP_ID=MMETSP0325_2-20121206/20127_1 /ASSEMBLY_ACC=CAM_ASM_000347 /TAXON_ID=2866 /ORGANISM="Crypthecodinium cohnii, Strain Seligo" /LENGTH=93 /DNA_ID=CAMNT_0054060405 /DNA_START=334 /DNA_END=616 /DNA_ORIENTATION=-